METEKLDIQRGDIVYVNFDAASGCVTNGYRPALVISNDIGNTYSQTVIVATISSKLKKSQMPTHLIVEYNKGLRKKSMLMLEQIRTVDKCCVVERTGRVSERFMERVNRALSISIGLDPTYNH